MHSSRKAFTLVEMLIVIVIIGILAAALIPRLQGIQSRSRDTARVADVRNIEQAIVLYSTDHDGNYPRAFLSQDPVATAPSHYLSANASHLSPSRALVQNETTLTTQTQGTVKALGENLGSYISLLPNDPSSRGIKTMPTTESNGDINTGGDCLDDAVNNTYAYYRDDESTMYAITMISEANNGNTSNCAGRVNSQGTEYKTVGQGLRYTNGIATSSYDPNVDGDPQQRCLDTMTIQDEQEWLALHPSYTKSFLCSTNSMSIESIANQSLPNSLIYMISLEELFISDNMNLTSLPSGIDNLQGLEAIEIYNNIGLQSIPSTIGNLENLRGLDIQSNPSLQSIPSTIGNLENIERIDLSSNSLQSIPNDFSNLANSPLIQLNIANNNLNSLPVGFCNMITTKGRSSPGSNNPYSDFGNPGSGTFCN